MELARLKRSRVKGHHVFKSESRPGDTFTCAREPGNSHSPDAIIVKLDDESNVGHVPDAPEIRRSLGRENEKTEPV